MASADDLIKAMLDNGLSAEQITRRVRELESANSSMIDMNSVFIADGASFRTDSDEQQRELGAMTARQDLRERNNSGRGNHLKPLRLSKETEESIRWKEAVMKAQLEGKGGEIPNHKRPLRMSLPR